MTASGAVSRSAWWWWGLVGTGASALALGALHLTHNPIVFPTLMLASNMVVPGAVLLFVLGRVGVGQGVLVRVALSFGLAAFVATTLAAVVEFAAIPRGSAWAPLSIAVVEEGAKLACAVAAGWGLWRLPRPERRQRRIGAADGLVLGVAAGAGFGVFESNGFAMTDFLRDHNELSVALHVTLLRAALAPMGHVVWSGLAGAALASGRARGRWGGAAGGIAAAVGLHAAWDAFPALLAHLVPGVLPPFVPEIALVATVGAAGVAALLFLLARIGSE